MLFKPEWGVYDMAVGKEVVSAYADAADINSFEDKSELSKTKTHKIIYSNEERILYALYTKVREMRSTNSVSEKEVLEIFTQVKKDFSKDWLLNLELYEVALQHQFTVQEQIHSYLLVLQENEAYRKLIENGLSLLKGTQASV